MKISGSKKISIGINGSMLDEQPTGVGVYSFNLINHLTNIESDADTASIKVFTPTTTSLNENVELIKLPSLLQSSRYGKLAAMLRFCWNNFYYPFQARQFDLLISPTTHGSFLMRRQIITIHDLLSLHYDNISAHQRMYFRYILPLMLKRAELVIAVSENTKNDIVKYFDYPAENIRVVHNGYDHARYIPSETAEKSILAEYGVSNYFLAVGPTYPHKNFERLIESWNALPGEVKRMHPLVIAGGKPAYLQTLKSMVAGLSLSEHVIFLGYVPLELMPSLYREALALVFPSLYEGFGIPMLEAMGCGCAVLASNTSSMPEVGGDAVSYFDPLDGSAISTAMLQVATEKEFRDALVQKGLKQVKKFSWLKMAESFSTLIHSRKTLNQKPSYV